MMFKVVGDHFMYWVDIEPSQLETLITAHYRAYRCRDFYVKRRIKQVFDSEGNVVYQT